MEKSKKIEIKSTPANNTASTALAALETLIKELKTESAAIVAETNRLEQARDLIMGENFKHGTKWVVAAFPAPANHNGIATEAAHAIATASATRDTLTLRVPEIIRAKGRTVGFIKETLAEAGKTVHHLAIVGWLRAGLKSGTVTQKGKTYLWIGG